MRERMVGSYFRLYPKQARKIERTAKKRKIPIAELIRQLIDKHLS